MSLDRNDNLAVRMPIEEVLCQVASLVFRPRTFEGAWLKENVKELGET
jgi:hypothetical protein